MAGQAQVNPMWAAVSVRLDWSGYDMDTESDFLRNAHGVEWQLSPVTLIAIL